MNIKGKNIILIFFVLTFIVSILLLIVFRFGLGKITVHAASDAIAIRIIPNPNHYSAWRWYQNQGFQGAPQSLLVDGYEAVRDGRTVYVDVANVTPGKLYTNIYLISYNQDAESVTEDILAQILTHWSFNINYNASGHCRENKSIVCFDDVSCPISDYCDSVKARVVRDTKRLGDLTEINLALEEYKKKGNFPKLTSGSYLPSKTLSVWPSWNQTLAKELGISLPIDPINKLGDCSTPTGFNKKTCWNEAIKEFVNTLPEVPLGSLVYQYFTDSNGTQKNMCAVLESGLAPQNLNLLSTLCVDVCLDFDSDGYGRPDSAKCTHPQLDCNDLDPVITVGSPEVGANCSDGNDNDCDGFIDCLDSDCASAPVCFMAGSCNNNGTCESGENCASCAIDGCCSPPTCPDGFCDSVGTECSTCTADCNNIAGKVACCGLGGCNPGLGECLSTICTDCINAPACCGDGTCSVFINENNFSCPADCTSTCADPDSDTYDNCIIGAPGDDGKAVDCNDSSAAINPGAVEICDGIDNDCNAAVDEGFTAETCAFSCKALNVLNNYNSSRPVNFKCCGNDANEGAPYQADEKIPLNLCGDSHDNDCDNSSDMGDSDCSGACANSGENNWINAATPGDCNQCDYEGDDNGNQLGNWTPYPGMADKCDAACGPALTTVQLIDFQNGSEKTPVDKCGDGIDNDCDGLIDTFDLADCPSVCTNGSTQPCGPSVGECVPGLQTCISGVWGSCVGAIGPSAEICDGKDNDCNGTNDDGLVAPLNANQQGVCLGSHKSCSGAAGWVNNYSSIPGNEYPNEISCDNKDNNCNGLIDDSLTQACYTGLPATRGLGECKDGTAACSTGTWGVCVGEQTPIAEICGDSKDNDCDGIVDNGCSTGCTFPATLPCTFP